MAHADILYLQIWSWATMCVNFRAEAGSVLLQFCDGVAGSCARCKRWHNAEVCTLQPKRQFMVMLKLDLFFFGSMTTLLRLVPLFVRSIVGVRGATMRHRFYSNHLDMQQRLLLLKHWLFSLTVTLLFCWSLMYSSSGLWWLCWWLCQISVVQHL